MKILQLSLVVLTALALIAKQSPINRPIEVSLRNTPLSKSQETDSGVLGHMILAPTCVRRRGKRGSRGAIYARFSTKFQASIDDQVRACKKWAEANGIEIEDAYVFADRARTGKTHRRTGLQKLLTAIANDEIDVLITFATNRLYRKMYRSLQLIDEEIVSRRKRCVFVAQNIDTEKSEFWRQLVSVFAMLDELQLQSQAAFVRAAHEGLLNRGLVHGTIAFGYKGVEEPAAGKTKLGRIRRRLEIDEDTAKWVRRIFHWFVVDKYPMAAMKRMLREQNAPIPPKCLGGWTRLAVRLVLLNRRYIGDYSYGWKEAVWQAKQGYVRQFPREKPRMEKWIERLRIIDDAMFDAAQERLAQYPARGGRRKKNQIGEHPPDLLKDLLWCSKHKRFLTTNGRFLHCRHCKEEGADGLLYSQVNRKLAVEFICGAVAGLISGDSEFISLVKGSLNDEIQKIQAPDPEVLKELDNEHSALTRKINFAFEAPAESEEDLREQKERLRGLQQQRAAVQHKRELLRKAAEAPVRILVDDEIDQEIRRIGQILQAAGHGDDDPQIISDARRIIDLVTGGRIEMSQIGEAKAKRGWLQGKFLPRVFAPFFAVAGSNLHATACAGEEKPVSIEFRRPPELDVLSDKVKSLVDQNLLMTEVADRLKLHRSRITKAYKHWFETRGLPIPDGRARRSTLAKKHTIAPAYQQIADGVMQLIDKKLQLGQIAKQLGVDRNTVTASIKWWHKQHNLPVPPGRGRRKEGDPGNPNTVPAPDSGSTCRAPESVPSRVLLSDASKAITLCPAEAVQPNLPLAK